MLKTAKGVFKFICTLRTANENYMQFHFEPLHLPYRESFVQVLVTDSPRANLSSKVPWFTTQYKMKTRKIYKHFF